MIICPVIFATYEHYFWLILPTRHPGMVQAMLAVCLILVSVLAILLHVYFNIIPMAANRSYNHILSIYTIPDECTL